MHFLYYIYLASLPIIAALGVYCYKKLYYNIKWFVPYFIFVVFYEFANFYNLLNIKNSNAWCNNLEGDLEFIFFSAFLIRFIKNPVYKNAQYFLVALVLVLSLIDTLFLHGFWKRNTVGTVAQGITILTFIFIYYYNLLSFPPADKLDLFKYPPFLAVTGLFFYYISTTFYYACFSFVVYNRNNILLMLASDIPAIANLLFNIFVISAFLCSLKTKKLSL